MIKKSLLTLTVIILFSSLLACGTRNKESQKVALNNNWLDSGSLSITRSVPQIIENTEIQNIGLGFSASSNKVADQIINKAKTVTINIKNGQIEFENSKKTSKNLSANNVERKTYKVVLKEENSVWHASDKYFQDRGLEVPAVGHKDRFLKSALGSYAIFLEGNKALHNAEISSKDVDGIYLESKDLIELD